ncbi:acetylornithine deacetylase [Novispirillum itersonii]|uniref:acetylornithine deacetylase n=1 Tax=Novispirillum itersonii TaxID=189 RepID=UPI0003633C3B|nr:acetylornithine deacetylase [Novispirillum itersonii]
MDQSSRDMIARLIGFDTVSRSSNLPLIKDVKAYLAGFGIESHLVYNADQTKANLYATIGPMVEGGVVLSGHTDVVPVDGQPWDTDPFTVVEKDGRLYGRGTCDMKAFSAVALALVPEMLAAGLKRPIHLALSYDEEVGCLGAPSMIERIVADLPRPEAVIVGEPTDMKPILGHKGVVALRTTITGHEAHSSQVHRGVSAVMTGARLITFIADMMAENSAVADPENPFTPPYTTLHCGVINGGTALNIISRECSFLWDIRPVPGDDWRRYLTRFEEYCATLTPAMQAIAPHTGIVTEVLSDTPSMFTEADSPAALLAYSLSGHNTAGFVPYGAEAGQFIQAGLSTVMCGPGSIDQAHQPNEFIEISQVTACEDFLRRLIRRQAV